MCAQTHGGQPCRKCAPQHFSESHLHAGVYLLYAPQQRAVDGAQTRRGQPLQQDGAPQRSESHLLRTKVFIFELFFIKQMVLTQSRFTEADGCYQT
jgi:hypothetical protein